MSTSLARSTRLASAARFFALVSIAIPILWAQDTAALRYLVGLGLVWGAGAWTERRDLPTWLSRLDLAEAALIGAVCAVALPHSQVAVAALAIPPFVSALRFGFPGTAGALSVEIVALTLVASMESGGLDTPESLTVFTWMVTGLGLGLVAGFFTATAPEPDGLASYRDARRLIRELLELSGGLSSGLDPQVLGNDLLDVVADRLPAAALTVHVPRDDGLTPLTRRVIDDAADPTAADGLALAAMGSRRVRVDHHGFAIPVHSDADLVCVVSGASPAGGLDSARALAIAQSCVDQLTPTAIRLDAALLFGALRDAATADERRRLAREMHDGVAQDIASLGYLVDAVAARPSSAQQAEQLLVLRDSITRIVAEVRRSVLTLRSGVDGAESLGAALGSMARHLSSLSGVPIQVTVDEQTTRLRPEVEAEVLRIAQEAMNNAVRHAEATQIDVWCRVDPPDLTLQVTDNGRGLQARRSDSHGLEIMAERARLVGATLHVGNRRAGGTEVSLRIASGNQSSASSVVAEKEVART